MSAAPRVQLTRRNVRAASAPRYSDITRTIAVHIFRNNSFAHVDGDTDHRLTFPAWFIATIIALAPPTDEMLAMDAQEGMRHLLSVWSGSYSDPKAFNIEATKGEEFKTREVLVWSAINAVEQYVTGKQLDDDDNADNVRAIILGLMKFVAGMIRFRTFDIDAVPWSAMHNLARAYWSVYELSEYDHTMNSTNLVRLFVMVAARNDAIAKRMVKDITEEYSY
jgi:hypothetical protein